MKRSHTIKIEDLQNSLLEGSIQEISQEQAKEIKGGSDILNLKAAPYHCPPYTEPSWPPHSDPDSTGSK
jgi:hypothetical protein